jgi:hypothetical protein
MTDDELRQLIAQMDAGPRAPTAPPRSIRESLMVRGHPDPLQPKNGEERSTADHLRPPYTSPVHGLTPATAGAARDLEVGFDGLPRAYQRALGQPIQPVTVGTMPLGYDVAGTTFQDGTPPHMLVDSPRTATHELVHVLARSLGVPWSAATEEALAEWVATGTPTPTAAVTRADQQVRRAYDPAARPTPPARKK